MKTLTTPTAVGSGREEFFTRLEGEREGTLFQSYCFSTMDCCNLTIEEWNAVQQLFAEAVSVNSSNISQAQCLAGIARREHLLSWRGYSQSAMNDEFDPGSG